MNVRLSKKIGRRVYAGGTRYRRQTLLAASRLRHGEDFVRRACEERLLGRWVREDGELLLVQAVSIREGKAIVIATALDGTPWSIGRRIDGNLDPLEILKNGIWETLYVEPDFALAPASTHRWKRLAVAGEPAFEEGRKIWTDWRKVIDAMPPGPDRDFRQTLWQRGDPRPERTVLIQLDVLS